MNSKNNNGLITKIWGPVMWESIHCVAFGYPVNPTVTQKRKYKEYFLNLGHVLPCSLCQTSYNFFINDKNSDTFLSDNVFKSRLTLAKWVFNLHNRVNKKLNVNYKISFEDFVNKYESYRAKCNPKYDGCVMTPNDKMLSYINSNKKNHAVISMDTASKFNNYASERGIQFNLNKYNKMLKNTPDKNWDDRNKYCDAILTDMRINGINYVEEKGKYKGLPTIHELHLLSRLCSSVDENTLKNMIK